MLTHWIQISLLGFGIILSTLFFLRSSFLKKRNAEKLEGLLIHLGHKIDMVDRHLQEVCMDIKDLTIRTTIVETRLEERNVSHLISSLAAPKKISSSSGKRGRPRKTPQQ